MSCSARLHPDPRARLALHARSLPSRGPRALAASRPLARTRPVGKHPRERLPSRAAGRRGAGGPGPAASARLLIYIRHALVTSPALRRRTDAGARAWASLGPACGCGSGGEGRNPRGRDFAGPGSQRQAWFKSQGWSHLFNERKVQPIFVRASSISCSSNRNSGKVFLPVDSKC